MTSMRHKYFSNTISHLVLILLLPIISCTSIAIQTGKNVTELSRQPTIILPSNTNGGGGGGGGIGGAGGDINNPAGKALFSPRVDYNEWLPVGRGDPLKNDPTYDYSPPVLDRVRYWGDSTKDKSGDVLVLGVSNKKPIINRKNNNKYMPIRRNFYHQLPTVLMPPPMQTMPSGHMPTENYQQAGLMSSPPSGSWSSHKGSVSDASVDGTNGFMSFARPNSNYHKNVVAPHPHPPPPLPPSKYHSQQNMNFGEQQMQHRPTMDDSSSSMDVKLMGTNIKVGNSYSDMNKKPSLHSILQKEVKNPRPNSSSNVVSEYAPTIYESHSTIIGSVEQVHHTFNNFKYNEIVETTTHFTPTIQPATMTTDALFSHYKQPSLPLRGPMYLIIEGHSKVKTYGLNDENKPIKHEPKIVPIMNTEDPVNRRVVSHDDNGQASVVKHLHFKQPATVEIKKPQTTPEGPSSMENLLSLLDSSFGNFLLNDKEQTVRPNSIEETEEEEEEKKSKIRKTRHISDKDFKETQVSSSFSVGGNRATSNNAFDYRKGTVEDEELPDRTHIFSRR